MALLPLSPQEQAVGTYLFAAVSMTRWRLTLHRDGRFCLEAWRDMGGFWHVLNAGRFWVSEGQLLFERDFLSPYRMEYGILTAPMVLRQWGQDWFWVPQRYLADFEKKRSTGFEREKFVYLEHGLFCFLKQKWPKLVICVEPDVYRHALTFGQRYLVLEERTDYLRLFGDHRRLRWFPKTCFASGGATSSATSRGEKRGL